jgi:transcriptional regulator with XRE-family HTH domain
MLDPTVIGPGGRDQRPRPLLRTMLGDVLRRARLEQGRTLADVARVARVSMPYLSEVERGRKEASSEVLAAICDSLGIDLSDVLAEIWRELADLRIRRARADRLARLEQAGRLGRMERAGRLGTIGGERSEPQQRGEAGAPTCLLAA